MRLVAQGAEPRDRLALCRTQEVWVQEQVGAVLRQARVSPGDVIGIGTDFTACTMLPTKADGTPCTNKAKEGSKYCGVHSKKYDG